MDFESYSKDLEVLEGVFFDIDAFHNEIGDVRFIHMQREANGLTNGLAKLGLDRLRIFLACGENSSAVMIARPNITQASSFQFGRLFAIDDLFILEPEPTSTLIGNAQVLYVSSSRDPVVFTSVMYADFAFTNG
ncbi:hypothetical protein Goshw_013921, partial [Gossypium schwendimanii]|nr:hypothetical protein [Gossypium schwendimanii]